MTRLYWHLALIAVITFGGLAAVLFLARFGADLDLGVVIFFAGSVGAVVNNYFRLAKIADAGSELPVNFDRKIFTFQLYVSALISGILGFIMYGLCLSGLLDGALFPKFQKQGDTYASLTNFLQTIRPASNADTAKSIIWAFTAGFSERLIPNILDRIVAQSESQKEGRRLENAQRADHDEDTRSTRAVSPDNGENRDQH